MKKGILVVMVIGLLVSLSYSRSEAHTFMDSPFTTSYFDVYTNFNEFGDHAVVTYESTDNLGSFFAVVLDTNGVPVASSDTYGYYYLFADVQSNGTLNIYGSNTGASDDWHLIGNF